MYYCLLLAYIFFTFNETFFGTFVSPALLQRNDVSFLQSHLAGYPIKAKEENKLIKFRNIFK